MHETPYYLSLLSPLGNKSLKPLRGDSKHCLSQATDKDYGFWGKRIRKKIQIKLDTPSSGSEGGMNHRHKPQEITHHWKKCKITKKAGTPDSGTASKMRLTQDHREERTPNPLTPARGESRARRKNFSEVHTHRKSLNYKSSIEKTLETGPHLQVMLKESEIGWVLKVFIEITKLRSSSSSA